MQTKCAKARRRVTLLFALVLGVLLALLLGGCQGAQEKQNSSETGGYEVKDVQGQVLKLPRKPQRIVTLALSSDEMALAMLPAQRLAALHYLADDPGISTEAAKAQAVTARVRDYNVEQLLSLQPDLVLAPDWNRQELIQTLRDAGLPVVVTKGPSSVAEVKEALQQIALAAGEPQAGQKLIEQMELEMADIAAKVQNIPQAQKKTVVLISHMASYGGKGSLFDNMCRDAGVINGAAAVGLGKNDALTKEAIVAANPDVILVPTWTKGKLDVDQVRQELLNDPALQSVKAIREKKLVQVSDAYLYCAAQDITKGIRGIAAAAYPERFE
ncbi:ABC transporter substrate-binding protein [uncultured Anaeromusa sp.]|uniref:ABC transporter substrate-binding protein n=1 Tax=uncultured Anaeromusa sp. TaxID=673273 RepID=UPI0029C97DC3|nr:ABC transporter substrate-binding protein [uncultured Anaeromusa sp.]